jgi:hypothetical protein
MSVQMLRHTMNKKQDLSLKLISSVRKITYARRYKRETAAPLSE